MPKLTTEEFIAKAKAVHGDRYDYSKVEYVNNQTPIKIICPIHGVFEQRPNNHFNGNGCPKCARAVQSARQAMSQDVWIERAKHIHNNKYDYSKVAYVNNHTPIKIICPIHGEFIQTPANHMIGQGCPICGKTKIRLSQEEARKRISEKLALLPYELVEPFVYKGDRDTDVTIHCKKHDFTWTTSWHQVIYAGTKLNGICPKCRKTFNKDICHNAALQCQYRSEFAERFESEYMAALRNNWLDEICSHMTVLGNRYQRCIYAYEFPNIEGKDFVYVGLTDNIVYRDKVHRRKGSVFSFCQKHNLSCPHPIQLTKYISRDEATEKEGFYLTEYISKGWFPINRKKTGGLGGRQIKNGFTFEECKTRGQRYSKRSDWKREDYPTYYIASKRGWIDKILAQRETFGNKTKTYWTLERLHKTALLYSSRSEFRRKAPAAYQRAHKKGIIDEICSHMKRLLEPTGYSLEGICVEIDKYETLSDFIVNCPRMYDWLMKRKIKLRDISDKPYKKPKGTPKPVHQFTLDGIYVRSYNNARETEAYGFNYKNVSAVCHGKRKSHKGFVFRFER